MLTELTLFNLNNNDFLINYLPVIIFAGVAFFLVVGLLFGSYIITPQLPYGNKNSQYECGFDAFADSRKLFNIRFYLVAILFIVFDVEIAFLYPWALVIKEISNIGFYSAIVFLLILTFGFIYEFKKGVLEWN